MSALATADPTGDHRPSSLDEAWGPIRLSSLLGAAAERHVQGIALKDQAGREAWSQRPPIDWTYPFALDVIRRLAGFFAAWGLPPRSPVGICLSNSSEACLTILAVEHAGLVPCLLPIAWAEGEIGAALEAANVSAVVTQAVVGDERPAEMFCRLAARYFGLRFVCSFGPLVPDGVIDLDRIILGDSPDDPAPAPEAGDDGGLVTFSRKRTGVRPVFRSCRSVVAAAVTFLVTAKIRPGERIVSLVAPDDHRGLTTTLIASLVGGATLECHGLFDGRTLLESLEEEVPTHLVAPAWMEAPLAAATLPDTVASVILIHEAPTRFKAKTSLCRNVVDVVAFGELALIAGARGIRGQFCLSLDDPARGNAGARHLLRIRHDEDGSIHFGGLAADAHAFERGASAASPRPEWRPSGFKADMFAGILIGLVEQAG